MKSPVNLLRAAATLLQEQRIDEARANLVALQREFPADTEVARLFAAAQLAGGEPSLAAQTLRAALLLEPHNAALQAALGEVLLRCGMEADAERALRLSLQLDPSQPGPCLSLLRLLRAHGRAAEAVKWAQRLTALMPQVPDAHVELAQALSAAGRADEAVTAQLRVVELTRGHPAAALQLALLQVDADRFAEAEALLRELQSKGFDVPEVWFGLARAALGLDRHAEAEQRFREAIRRRPDYFAAHADLAQAVWTRCGDLSTACAELDAVLLRHPELTALRVAKAALYRNAGEVGAAYAQLREALLQRVEDVELLIAAAETAGTLDAEAALDFAERAHRLEPEDATVQSTLGNAQLGVGQADAAAGVARRLLARNAEDQQALAMLSTAQRLLAGTRDHDLASYTEIVRSYTIDTPQGWPDLSAYLKDLAAGLRRLHTSQAHPLGQTLREGTQTRRDLRREADPAIRAFTQAVDGPIQRYITDIGRGDGPLRSRNTGRYRVQGMWSVQLRPYGFHVDHFHPEGWLSSACYIDLPATIGDSDEHAGWIKFGEPGIRTQPLLAAEHFVKPQPGLLVLFPSYLWHGTVPFAGPAGQSRLTIAFDVVPD